MRIGETPARIVTLVVGSAVALGGTILALIVILRDSAQTSFTDAEIRAAIPPGTTRTEVEEFMGSMGVDGEPDSSVWGYQQVRGHPGVSSGVIVYFEGDLVTDVDLMTPTVSR